VRRATFRTVAHIVEEIDSDSEREPVPAIDLMTSIVVGF